MLLIIASCSSGQQQPIAANSDWDNDSAQAINVGDVTTTLPQAGNVELIKNNCSPCHSLRYIQIQPQLSYKTWEKIVDKMITTYGAPIHDSITRERVIDYLYAIKGKKEMPKSGH